MAKITYENNEKTEKGDMEVCYYKVLILLQYSLKEDSDVKDL